MKSFSLLFFALLISGIPEIQKVIERVRLTVDFRINLADNKHIFVLKKEGGQKAVEQFRKFLANNLHFDGKVNLSAKANTVTIQGFKLSLKNSSGVDIQLQFSGFETFELRWKLDEQQKPYDCFYQLNQEEAKPLPLNNQDCKSKIRSKYHHQN